MKSIYGFIRQHMHVWRGMFWSLVISAMVAELTSAVGLKLMGRPIYWANEKPWQAERKLPLRTEKDLWGVWGIPNSTSRLIGNCFDVEYKFNSIGARDKERQIRSPKRWIVLGDSFVEGYGIAQSDRFTNILEERSGWEFEIFGAGEFGPLNYLLIYRHLAKKFEHHGVIVGFLPFNDFTDNDSEWWRLNRNRRQQYRYKPYIILSSDQRSYRVIYGANGDAKPTNDANVPPAVPPTPSPSNESQKLPVKSRALRKLSEVSALFNLLRQLKVELDWRKSPPNLSYFTDDQREITAVKLVIDDLSREIGDRPKIMLIFPTHFDLVERRRRGRNYSDQLSRFFGDLRSSGWTVIDTADALSEADQSGNIGLGCDEHWNSTTNRRIAEFLLTRYREFLTGLSTPSIK